MNWQEQMEQIKARFPGITVGQDAAGNTVLTVPPGGYAGLCRYLVKEAEPVFDYLSSLSGVDYSDRFEVVLHLLATADQRRVTIKTLLDKAEPELPSVTGIWPTANWHEREAYDLFGIRFTGHPNLKRILLVEDFPGHPLRKDYRQDPA